MVTPNVSVSNWLIFPTLAQDGFYVQSKNEQTVKNQFHLVDAIGRKQDVSISKETENKFYIDVRQLSSGQYWFVAENGTNRQVESILVTH